MRDQTNVVTKIPQTRVASKQPLFLVYLFIFFLKQTYATKVHKITVFYPFLLVGRRINMLKLGNIQETLGLVVYVVKIAVHFVTTPLTRLTLGSIQTKSTNLRGGPSASRKVKRFLSCEANINS